VWGDKPWPKLERSAEMAHALGADVVVVHPPFRWQRDYARGFREGVRRLSNESDVRFAVENMFPLRVRGREVSAYQPSWDVAAAEPYRDYTLDLSHAAVSQSDAMAMLAAMGDRLRHVHLADGTGLTKDEHLVPGRGNQPCAEFLGQLAEDGFDGHIVVEINTRKAGTPAARESALLESLAFCRLHFATEP
jgi:sugar phosphate isomerase/epimerase